MSGYSSKPFMIERIVAALSYITMGFAGFIWLILGIFTKAQLRPFMQYHIFQSIFIAFLIWLIVSALGFAMHLISYVPIVKTIVSMVTFFLNTPLFMDFSIVSLLYFLLILYLIIGVIRGSDSYVFWVSDIIKTNLRGQF